MRKLVGIAAFLATSAGLASPALAERPTTYDQKIAELAAKHKVPERLIHRVIMRESRYRAHAVSRGNYGLMQIRYGTARSMGYRGSPSGLTDGITNLTYAVPYLANAYHVAHRNEDRAVRLYASGFYYHAKRQGMLGKMQMPDSEPEPIPVAYAPTEQPTGLAALFSAMSTPQQNAAMVATSAVAADVPEGEAAETEFEDAPPRLKRVPLPPRRMASR